MSLLARSKFVGKSGVVRAHLAMALVLVLGCEDPPAPTDAAVPDAGMDAGGSGTAPCSRDAGPLDSGSARGLTNTCAQALILSGFGLRVGHGAWPIARYGVLLRPGFPDTCMAGSRLRGATLTTELDLRAGEGTVAVTHHVVGAGDPPPPMDAGAAWVGVRVARGSVRIDLDGQDEVRVPVLFDLSAAGLDGAPEIAVVLDGIELDTDVSQGPGFPPSYDPADGYALRTVGASIDSLSRDGVDLRFEVAGSFGVGSVGETEMDRAAAVARLEMVVHYAVVGLQVAPVTGSLAYRERHFGHGEEELAVCRPDPAVTQLTLAGLPGMMAAPALTSFRIALFPDDEGAGEYVHELSILVDSFEHDAASGVATMQVEGYVSNEGPPTPRRPMDYGVEARVALLSWTGPDEVVPLRYRAPIGVGRTDRELPLTP